MIRAVFFDFYSVWTPDKLAYYLAYAELINPVVYKEIYDCIQKYYLGQMKLDDLTGTIRYKLEARDVAPETFKLSPNAISAEIVKFMQDLHGHFVKIGILGNLGPQEYDVLKNFNDKNKIIDIIASPYSLKIQQTLLEREVFNKALQSIGETAESCLYVSGNPYHLAFAKAMGLQVLHFEGLGVLESNLNKMIAEEIPN